MTGTCYCGDYPTDEEVRDDKLLEALHHRLDEQRTGKEEMNRQNENAESKRIGEALKDQAFRRLETANEVFIREARECLIITASKTINRMEGFTIDDVKTNFNIFYPTTRTPPEPRAWGAVVSWAAHKRLIRPTGDYRPSVNPLAHCRPLRVWRLS